MSMYRNELYSAVLSRCYTTIMTWTKVGVVAIVCSGIVAGYYIYRDKKRKMDPGFGRKGIQIQIQTPIPDRSDREAVRKYCVQQITRAEEHLKENQMNQCVDYIAHAVDVHDDDENGTLIKDLADKLPPEAYRLLVQRLPPRFEKKKLLGGDFSFHFSSDEDGSDEDYIYE